MLVFPKTLMGKLFGLLSTNVLLWQVSKTVPGIAVSGASGGVKFDVYIAEFTARKFEMYPENIESGFTLFDAPTVTLIVDATLSESVYEFDKIPFM